MTAHPALGLLLASLAVAACSDNPTSPNYDPDIPTTWAAAVTNTWFPLAPGTMWVYEEQTPEGLETNTVEVEVPTRQVNGVTATVVHDQVFLDGVLTEDTYDWYAQDTDGNVWYLGEDSKEMNHGNVVSTEGSWEWGVDNALPGVIMWADPTAHVGEKYRQEFYHNHAEDWGRVLSTGETATVPAGTYSGCIKTEDWSGLSSGREHKYYCPDIGTVLEVGKSGQGRRTEMTSFDTP